MGLVSRLRGGCLVLLVGLASSSAMAEDRPAGKILADINAAVLPKPPEDRNDRAAVQEFLLKRQKAADRRSNLIGELYKSHPDAAELPELIAERWLGAMMPDPKAKELTAELEDVLARSSNQKLVAQAAFIKGLIGFRNAGQAATAEVLMPIADEFIKRAPKDPRGALFLANIASKVTDETRKAAIEKRIVADYPESPVALQMTAETRLKDAVGKPFEIEFVEAIKGGQVSASTLKGKVVIVDFWATWCGPCVAEMPNMKKLYAQYKDKGVEFVGVSLDQPRDQGGYEALKSFVEKNNIEWPQYYEGKVPATDFASRWGIQSIPTVFAVGADGNLASTQARGQLEELIPQLLEEAKKAKAKP